jgi:TPR repeat protein
MIKTVAIGFAVTLSVHVGSAHADFAAGSAAYAAGNYRAAWDEWFAAALDDESDAQQGLARLYEAGDGVSQSFADAYVWYQLADFHGDVDLTQKLSDLGTHLTDGEVADSIKAAIFWTIKILERGSARRFSGSAIAHGCPTGYTCFDMEGERQPPDRLPALDEIGSQFTF